MADQTHIEWCDSTFNPWIGCTKVSPACDHCYAAVSTPARTLSTEWGAGQPRRRTSVANWAQPLRWNSKAEEFGQCDACGGRGERKAKWAVCQACKNGLMKSARRRVFCASLADVFDNEIDWTWRRDLFEMIRGTPNLDWLLLTKRIGNVLPTLTSQKQHVARNEAEWRFFDDWIDGRPPSNVWLGATICNQAEADRDIPKLLATPASVRFLSIEPLLGPVFLNRVTVSGRGWQDTLNGWRDCLNYPGRENTIDWVVAGGESGPHARPMHPDWVRSLRDQCAAACVPFLFKQWGEWRPPLEAEDYDTSMGRAQTTPAFIVSPTGTVHCFESEWTSGGSVMRRSGKKRAGRLLDGIEHNGYPRVPYA
jgi:protein gp37